MIPKIFIIKYLSLHFSKNGYFELTYYENKKKAPDWGIHPIRFFSLPCFPNKEKKHVFNYILRISILQMIFCITSLLLLLLPQVIQDALKNQLFDL